MAKRRKGEIAFIQVRGKPIAKKKVLIIFSSNDEISKEESNSNKEFTEFKSV